MFRRHQRRRGVVILVVLSLLVLFTLLAATYIIVSGQYRRAAEASARQELLGVQPQKDLDRAMYQLLRDTRQRGSAVRYHSLLRDYYGEEGFTGSLLDVFPAGSPPPTLTDWNTLPIHAPGGGQTYTLSGGQFRDLIVNAGTLAAIHGGTFTLSSQPGYYSGCVLTITSGPAKGWSTTIVGFFYAYNAPVLRVLNLPTDSGTTIAWNDLANVSFIVNGRPFSGSGVGFQIVDDTTSGNTVRVAKLDAAVTVSTATLGPFVTPAALLPHHIARNERGELIAPVFVPDPTAILWRGGSNEPYDAVDYHNMALGLVMPNASSSLDIIPSFHRPALINYWMDNFPNEWADNGAVWGFNNFRLKRSVMMRPIEPNFDGSNPEFSVAWAAYQANPTPATFNALRQRYVNGPWDVDNDGDGIPDSVWIDLGLPTQTALDGRRYKPLFAFLCVDLDGRLNVNAHGNPTQFYANRPSAIALAAGNTANFPKGLGSGTPEIVLAGVTSNLSQLLNSRHANGVPGSATPAFDLLARIKFFEEPGNYFSGNLSSYFTPPDLRGELAFGLDVFGRPNWEQIPAAVVESRANSPYELNLLEQNAHDRPFTVAELEAILRRYDLDAAQLPRRLRDLLNLTDVENARLVTTHSFDPPVPGTALLSDLAEYHWNQGLTNVRSVQELVAARLRENGVAVAAVPGLLRDLLPSEVLLGQRLDINRLLGDGRDSLATPNRLVDEIGEQTGEQIWGDVFVADSARTEFQNVPIYHTNGTDVNKDGAYDVVDHRMARQLLARHIYVLLMALKDKAAQIDMDADTNVSDEETAYAIAQFAINVVDFRDADSIMTPFEFDVFPFDANGWNVDGDLTTTDPATEPNRGVVWGCERPELVISETLAWHDRRTEDRDDDDGIGARTDDPDPNLRDPHYDQRLMPRGPFFVELFNPWTATDYRPAELYDAANTGVQLNKVVTAGGVTSPVWRMMFVKDALPGQPRDPDHPDPNRRPNPNPMTGEDETRLIYFVNPTVVGVTVPATTGVTGVYATSLAVGTIAPGRYAVVGSPGINSGQDYISPIGRSLAATGEATLNDLAMGSTRRVVLSTAAGHQVRVLNNATGVVALPADPTDPAIPGTHIDYPNPDGTSIAPYVSEQPAAAEVLPAQAIIIDLPPTVPLSVSEPPDGYDPLGFQDPATSGTVEGYYATPRDIPLDLDRYNSQLMSDGTMLWGTIHLQRLANPNLPFNPTLNPYRTIDSLRVDLTTFNGLGPVGSEILNGGALPRQFIRSFSVQRGDAHSLATTATDTRRPFWPQEPVPAPQTADFGTVNPPTHHFGFWLRTTLGSLNHGFWPFSGQVAGAYRGSPSVDLTDNAAPHNFTKNDHAFSSLAWNNRPFVSGYELMQVPVQRSSQLLRWYWLPLGSSPYDTANPTAQYGHMVNFFHCSPFNQQDASVHAYRLLEYVQVPSRFVGTDVLLNPAAAPTSYFRNHLLPDPPYTGNPPNQTANPSVLNPSFLTPFNHVSRYRDPGRVNINTIYHEKVWQALFGGYAQAAYGNLVASRRGSAGASTDLLARNGASGLPDPRFPTFFANPIRPPGHGSLVPLAHLERQDVEATLLRSDAVPPDYAGGPDASPPGQNPLLALLAGGHVAGSAESIAATHSRNSMFRYNALQRLGNMVTTRSNVYAIWITVGYFEVEPNIPPGQQFPIVDVFHPDGFRVAQELGIDTGQVRRHRAFYIIDRTIPVAFQPGQNHNVDRAVLLRRFIE